MYSVYVRLLFSAAHHSPGDPGPCGRVHGHDYEVIVWARGKDLNSNGYLLNALFLEDAVRRFLDDHLEHLDLNQRMKLTTMEAIAEHICKVAHRAHPQVNKCEVNECRGRYGAIYEMEAEA